MSRDNEIKEIVLHVLSARHSLTAIDENAVLTAAPISASGEEIVYIVLELMEKYQITFDKEDFDAFGFNSIAGIIRAVNRHII